MVSGLKFAVLKKKKKGKKPLPTSISNYSGNYPLNQFYYRKLHLDHLYLSIEMLMSV